MWVVGIYFNDTDDVIMTVSNILKVSAVFVRIEANGLIVIVYETFFVSDGRHYYHSLIILF